MAAEPDFASRPLRWTSIVFAFVLLAIFIRVNDFLDVSETALERMNVIQSPTLRLAEKMLSSTPGAASSIRCGITPAHLLLRYHAN
jgi:hypothetical protein